MHYWYYSTPLLLQLTSAVAKVGIPGLPDLTQPAQLSGLASSWIGGVLVISFLFIGLGLVLALLNFTLKPQQPDVLVAVGGWTGSYVQLIKFCQHAVLVLSLLGLGFLLCSTLANRYHFWEQARFVQTHSQAIEQVAPEIRYTVKEPFSYTTQLNGRVVKVQDRRDVTKLLLPSSSNILVKIVTNKTSSVAAQTSKPAAIERLPQSATINFVGEYTIKNIAPTGSDLTLLMPPPTGSALIQNFAVEQDGQLLAPLQAGVYKLPLAVNGTSELRVSYQAQGIPSWLYDSKGQLLAGFKLVIGTDTKSVDALGSLLPSQTDEKVQGKNFAWTFDNNVTVSQPFGVAPIIHASKQIGLFPRLLIIAPAIWLWWLILLYLSLPLRLRDVAVSSGVFWVMLWVLVYGSRLVRTELANTPVTSEILWISFSALLLLIAIVIGRDRKSTLVVVLCTVVGLVFPVLALISSYSGLLLGLAGLLSLGWLATPSWYGKLRRSPTTPQQPPTPHGEPLALGSERLKEIDPEEGLN